MSDRQRARRAVLSQAARDEESLKSMREYLESLSDAEFDILRSWFDRSRKSRQSEARAAARRIDQATRPSPRIHSLRTPLAPRGQLDKALANACLAIAEEGRPITLSAAYRWLKRENYPFTRDENGSRSHVGVRLAKIAQVPDSFLELVSPKKGSAPAIYMDRRVGGAQS